MSSSIGSQMLNNTPSWGDTLLASFYGGSAKGYGPEPASAAFAGIVGGPEPFPNLPSPPFPNQPVDEKPTSGPASRGGLLAPYVGPVMPTKPEDIKGDFTSTSGDMRDYWSRVTFILIGLLLLAFALWKIG